jgi:hypothetical protein
LGIAPRARVSQPAMKRTPPTGIGATNALLFVRAKA